MLSEGTFNKIERERRERQTRAGTRNIRVWKETTRAHTWERAEKSAIIALKVLTSMPCASEAEHEWREDVRELVASTLQNIRDKKKQEFAPLEQYLFWYDVDREAAQKLTQMIKTFPGDNCPIRMM